MTADVEQKEEGGVASKVYLRYLQAGHGHIVIPLLLVLFSIAMVNNLYCFYPIFFFNVLPGKIDFQGLLIFHICPRVGKNQLQIYDFLNSQVNIKNLML